MKKTKHVMVIMVMAVILALEAGFLVYGFQRMEASYVDTYLEQQKQYMSQISLHLEYMLDQGAGQQEIVSYMAEHIPVSGSYYAWLAKNKEMIFVKNETVTSTLGEERAWPVFQEMIDSEESCHASLTFTNGGTEYVIGVVTDREYILANRNLQIFKVYGAVSLIVLGLMTFSVLLIYMQGYWQKEQRTLFLEEELQDKNSILEEVYGEVDGLNQKLKRQHQEPQNEKSYDLHMARKLLEKSERLDVQPAHYTVIQLQMDAGLYYGKQQIMDIMGKVLLDERHVRMEIHKGCFLIMFYRTGRFEMEEILKKAESQWQMMNITLDLKSGVIAKGTAERRWLDEFLAGKEN